MSPLARAATIVRRCRGAQIAGGSDAIGGPFTLVNGEGETVTDEDVITKPSLIYFGYTFCPDVCPLDTARNADAVDMLEKRGNDVTPVFISIDPARDTPEVVAEFADNMHRTMIGLTGSAEQVKAAAQAYRTYYKAQDPRTTTITWWITRPSPIWCCPEHGFVDFFRRDVTAEQMADTVACFVGRRLSRAGNLTASQCRRLIDSPDKW